MTQVFDALIVGCGIAGASLAFSLAGRGLKVGVLERGLPGSGNTGFSAAIVRQHYSTPLMARLARKAVGIWQRSRETLGRDTGYRRAGYLLLAPATTLATTERNVAMHRDLGIDTRMLTRAEIEAIPWLDPDGVAGAAFEPDGGYADPQMATEAFIAAAIEKGAVLMARTPVRRLLRSGDAIEGVETDEREIRAPLTILAAGPWSKGLAASAGIPMEMRIIREQDTVWEMRGNRPLPTESVSNGVDALYIRPMGERRYIIGRGYPKDYADADPGNYKLTADDRFIADVQERMTRHIPPFDGARLINAYAALFDVSVDWYQYAGPRRGLSGYADFCCGSGHGFKEAPAIAEELADWLVRGEVADDFRRLSCDRIADGGLFVQSYGGSRG